MKWSLISAVNDRSILTNSLLGSSVHKEAHEFIQQEGFRNASSAYNAAINDATGDYLVFAHQDIYLPNGWNESLCNAIHWLGRNSPNWGVLGVFGVNDRANSVGHVYSTGLGRPVGKPFREPSKVSTLDEIILIIRRDSGLSFDSALPGFHLYGTDICLEARSRGFPCYAFPGYCIHNTNGISYLPVSFWKAYFFLRRKWRAVLPVATPCTQITWSAFPMVRSMLRSFYSHTLRGRKPGKRVQKPEELFRTSILKNV
jgi:glycosyltransferase involved in cell wall biosynthesis